MDHQSGPFAPLSRNLGTPQDAHEVRKLFDDYIRRYASRDDGLVAQFSENFSGFTGGGDFLVKDRAEWVAITRQDFAQVRDPIRIELKDVALQSLAETVCVATAFFTIHLPVKEHVLSRTVARLVLIFRRESAGWKISHSSISLPDGMARAGEVYPLQELSERNRLLEEQIAERTAQLSAANETLRRTNAALAKEIAERERAARQLEALLTSRTGELREATAAALRAGAEEEDRIGRELHDTLCPDLIGLARRAETVAGQPELPPIVTAPLRALADQAAAASRRARDLSHLLAKPDFTRAPFDDLLRADLHRLEVTLGLSCELTIDEALPSLDPEANGHLLRIVREAVVNAARHAGAQRVWIDCVTQGATATLSISNDGRALPPADTLKAGLGLRQIRMRAELLEATLALRAGPAGGAVMELTFPTFAAVTGRGSSRSA